MSGTITCRYSTPTTVIRETDILNLRGREREREREREGEGGRETIIYLDQKTHSNFLQYIHVKNYLSLSLTIPVVVPLYRE